MQKPPANTLDPRAFRAWVIRGIITGIVLLAIPTSYFIAISHWLEWPPVWGWLLLTIVLIYSVLETLIFPKIRLKFWRYEIHQDEIDIQHGILIIKRTLIPMVRVQHVDTEHGPIMRKFGLATLSIYTAGSTHKIPALAFNQAQTLRSQIAHLAQVSDEDV